jgi:hypothetical protein
MSENSTASSKIGKASLEMRGLLFKNRHSLICFK